MDHARFVWRVLPCESQVRDEFLTSKSPFLNAVLLLDVEVVGRYVRCLLLLGGS